MGKSYSKVEEKEIVIAQNSGANSVSLSEDHIKINNILITTLMVMIAIAVLIVLCLKLKEKHKKYIEDRVSAEFVRRMRSRLSGKRDQRQDAEAEM